MMSALVTTLCDQPSIVVFALCNQPEAFALDQCDLSYGFLVKATVKVSRYNIFQLSYSYKNFSVNIQLVISVTTVQ